MGALIMLILVLLTGLLNVDKVTAVIGAITPVIIILIVGVTGYTLLTTDLDVAAAHEYAVNNVDGPLPNWWLSAMNYTGLNIMCAVSMAIVIGGNILDNRAVGLGGVLGGLTTLLLLALLVSSLFFVAPEVNGTDLPALALINGINPALGYIMTFAIFGMIFNTAVGMFYAMAKRLTRDKPHLFYPVYVIACLIGFALSFVGFQPLVANVYPILGYIGILMIAVMSFAWFKNRDKVKTETDRRMRARKLVARKLDPRKRFNKKNERELAKLANESNMATPEFVEVVSDEVLDELESDAELEDFDREDQRLQSPMFSTPSQLFPQSTSQTQLQLRQRPQQQMALTLKQQQAATQLLLTRRLAIQTLQSIQRPHQPLLRMPILISAAQKTQTLRKRASLLACMTVCRLVG